MGGGWQSFRGSSRYNSGYNPDTEEYAEEQMLALEKRNPAYITPKSDGPMLVMSDGQVYYLTFIERVLWVLGFTTPEKLEAKHRH